MLHRLDEAHRKTLLNYWEGGRGKHCACFYKHCKDILESMNGMKINRKRRLRRFCSIAAIAGLGLVWLGMGSNMSTIQSQPRRGLLIPVTSTWVRSPPLQHVSRRTPVQVMRKQMTRRDASTGWHSDACISFYDDSTVKQVQLSVPTLPTWTTARHVRRANSLRWSLILSPSQAQKRSWASTHSPGHCKRRCVM